jgi:hypothetical protein
LDEWSIVPARVTRHRFAMPRILLVLASALLLAAPASAEYSLSKGLAKHYSGHYARTHHALHKVRSFCRPKGHRATPHEKQQAHRWVCRYTGYDDAGTYCTGLIQIKGGSAHNVYWWLVYQGLRCRK